MRGIARSFLVSLWFMFLTFPLMVIRIGPDGAIIWRFRNALYLGAGIFLLSFVWRALLVVRGVNTAEEADLVWLFDFFGDPRKRDTVLGLSLLIASSTPLGIAVFSLLAGTSEDFSPVFPVIGLGIALLGLSVAIPILLGRRDRVASRFNTVSASLTQAGPLRASALSALFLFLLSLPWLLDIYRVNVMATTFIWIMLGLGLNIVVGQAGLLVLGYVAFYAVGAYTYAVGNIHFGSPLVGFWIFLPLGGLMAAVAGILLSLPVLRLRGDYLAIVTLGFGEIVRVTLEGGSISLAPLAWVISLFTDAPLPAWMTTPLDLGGPAGIGNIPYPGFFGLQIGMDNNIRFVYYIALFLAMLTIAAVARLRDSRVGRSWIALREDEIACEAMGINKVRAKLSAFALGACWAGFGGVLFASKTTFINPTSFTFMESALILSVVVLGGLGSILGVVLGACVLILLPEYLRSFNEYRMLIFGASMVLMMVFRPQGLIAPKPKKRDVAGLAGFRKTTALPEKACFAEGAKASVQESES